jgi:NADH:ubiquinone oxidoreductase subunit 6 (subunit J)
MQLPVALVAAAVLGIIIYAVTQSPWKIAEAEPLTPTTAPLANALFSQNGYILPVMIGAVLLLAAIIGAIIITREK